MVTLSLSLSTVLPAYAEVTSVYTDRTLYSIDMNVYFTGTVDNTDSQKLVNLLIKDPNGKIILMTGAFATSNDTFQISVNTNDQSQFSLKGTYEAIAFVNNESTGKTIFFDYSPNGTPVIHQLTEPENNTQSSQSIPGGSNSTTPTRKFESVLHENVNIVDLMNVPKIIPPNDNKLSSNTSYVESILYPVMVACGIGLVGFIVYQRMKRSKMNDDQSKHTGEEKDMGSQEDYALIILKNRLAKGDITLEEFKMVKDVLNEP